LKRGDFLILCEIADLQKKRDILKGEISLSRPHSNRSNEMATRWRPFAICIQIVINIGWKMSKRKCPSWKWKWRLDANV